jgi:hypothetical protein
MDTNCPHCDGKDCLPLEVYHKVYHDVEEGRVGTNCRHCNLSLYIDKKGKKVLSILTPDQAIKVR